jgi:small subunit ribosomal protein S8
MTSTVIDLIARIKNGYVARKELISGLYSKMNVEVLKILEKEHYIESFEVTEEGNKSIRINLKYDNGEPVLSDIQIVSKPGRRLYTGVKELKPVLGGLGIAIVTTPKGLMTDREVRKNNVGGEILFKVW